MLLDLDVDAIDDEHTRLTISLTLQPHWFMAVPNAILWPVLMRRRAQQVIDGTVANAKHLIEASQDV